MVQAQPNRARGQLSRIQLQHLHCLPSMEHLHQHLPQFTAQEACMDQAMHQDLHQAQHMVQDQLV